MSFVLLVILSYSREMSTINTRQIDIFVEKAARIGIYLTYCYYVINLLVQNKSDIYCRKLITTNQKLKRVLLINTF